MPKRKSAPCDTSTNPPVPLNSLDAALDLLVCDTFSRLDQLTAKFESCANVKLEDGVVKKRYEEAIKRYWVMKSMDELCCGARKESNRPHNGDEMQEDMDDVNDGEAGRGGRLLPNKPYPGAVNVHNLTTDEEAEWRRWGPKVGDLVLVDTADDGMWPGKIIDKKAFFQGRTVPRGNHFFPIRIYHEDMPPVVTVKSRLIPLHLRSCPPILASPFLLGAYHHAAAPTTFDMVASARESLAAHSRTHPGVGGEPERLRVREDKDAWNKVVNWVMNERRNEKLRAISEEREKQLRMVAKSNGSVEGNSVCRPSLTAEPEEVGGIFACQKKRRTAPEATHLEASSSHGVFGPIDGIRQISTERIPSPSLASFIRPALSVPQRPNSPRKSGRDKRRSGVFTGVGEHSPRGHRGGTYTPPIILANGDETAPGSNGSPVPTLRTFDFVSPLGPVRMGNLRDGEISSPTLLGAVGRSGSLEVVKEEEGEEDGWTVVTKKGRRRAGSEPLGDKTEMRLGDGLIVKEDDTMDLQ